MSPQEECPYLSEELPLDDESNTATNSLETVWVAALARDWSSKELVVVFCFLTVCIFAMRSLWKRWKGPRVWMMGFTTYKPPASWKFGTDQWITKKKLFKFSTEDYEFSMRVLESNGLGEETYFPPGLIHEPPSITMKSAREEAELVMFGCLEELLEKTGVKASEIDIIVVNCSLFNPTPSLTSMVVNKFKLREDVESYNLSGMGCSAGVIAIHLVKDLMKARPNSRAVVISTENITQNIYLGKQRNMQITNTLFRVGGAAILLSNRPEDAQGARYELLHTVRAHLGGDDEAYDCVFQEEDSSGITGVRLNRSIIKVASRALTKNMTRLGPLILPWSELIKYAASVVSVMVRKRLEGKTVQDKPQPPTKGQEKVDGTSRSSDAKPSKEVPREKKIKGFVEPQLTLPPQLYYQPNFRKAVDHFCIHAGGRGVIDGIQKALHLSDDDVAPSRHVLKRYGNTSSSSIWYELEANEAQKDIQNNDKVWQVAFGSGFMCNSAVWRSVGAKLQSQGTKTRTTIQADIAQMRTH